MDLIDRRRLAAAGLVAGATINVSGMISAGILGLADSFRRAGIVPDSQSLLLHLGLRFCVGASAAYLYAKVLTQREPGVVPVLQVALPVWLIGYAPPLALLNEVGFLTARQASLSAVWGLFEVCAAVAAAAAIYGKPARTGAR